MDLQQLYAQLVDEAAVKEATRFRTIPTGGYNVLVEPADLKQGEDAETPGTFNRWCSRVTAPVIVLNEAGEEQKLGNVFFTISPEIRRVEKGKRAGQMDNSAKLWYQSVKALRTIDAIAESANVRDVIKTLAKSPVFIFVIEFFVVAGAGPNGSDKWITVRGEKADEIKAKYLALGLEPQNMVTSIGAYKEEEADAEATA